MSKTPVILIVDDEPINNHVFKETLEQYYHLEFAETGEECLEKVSIVNPDLILLDVNMPGIGGLKTCENIKKNNDTTDIPVIFISALSQPEDRMNGYKAGGEDYITKPFEEAELRAKIELTLTSQQEKATLQQDSNNAMNMAMTAMTQAGEIGEVIQFTRDSYLCDTFEALAKRLLKTLSQFDLNATIRMTKDKKDIFFSTLGIIGDREQDAMEFVRENGRFIHCGKRTIINFNNISLLIKNMPIKETDRYGRINDVIGILLESADTRIEGIKKSSSLITLIQATRDLLADIEVRRKENENNNTLIIDSIENSINEAFNKLGLNEQQEEYFNNTITQAKEQNNLLFKTEMQIEKKIEHIIASLAIE